MAALQAMAVTKAAVAILAPIPRPSLEWKYDGSGWNWWPSIYVKVPQGDWSAKVIQFLLKDTAGDEAVWNWADSVRPDAWYYPGDLVMCGYIGF